MARVHGSRAEFNQHGAFSDDGVGATGLCAAECAGGEPGWGAVDAGAGGASVRTERDRAGLRLVRADGRHDLQHVRVARGKGAGDDWATDSEHAGVCAGPLAATGSGGSGWGNLSGWSRAGARLCAASGVDGGAVYPEPVWSRRDTVVPDW